MGAIAADNFNWHWSFLQYIHYYFIVRYPDTVWSYQNAALSLDIKGKRLLIALRRWSVWVCAVWFFKCMLRSESVFFLIFCRDQQETEVRLTATLLFSDVSSAHTGHNQLRTLMFVAGTPEPGEFQSQIRQLHVVDNFNNNVINCMLLTRHAYKIKKKPLISNLTRTSRRRDPVLPLWCGYHVFRLWYDAAFK